MLVSIFYAFQLSICFGIITSYNKVKFILKPTSLKMNSLTMQTSAPYSFVNNDLRPYAMKLHTPQQMKPQAAESETKPAQAPATEWKPSRINYIQFLVDSLAVYETLEDISSKTPILSPFKSTGLERSAALKEDLKWLSNQYSIKIPPPGPHGPGYSAHLRELAKTSIPKYMCHYYNHMFAHTAGGRMIGKKMADTFLDGTTLKFYQWEDDVKVFNYYYYYYYILLFNFISITFLFYFSLLFLIL